MPYQIKCDDYPIFDSRDDALTVSSPVVNLEVNTTGGCTFTIHKNHPYYDKLKPLKSVFEVSDEIGVIFRGRMTESSFDLYNSKSVDIEGVLAYFNDSIIRPFSFPEDFTENNEYIAAAESGNVVAFFLKWLINRHNEQVQPWQRFRLGNVTVSDPNNYLSRSDTAHKSTWETLKGKLFDSALGGYLCIRYEPDGNYIDYLSDFTVTNTQEIAFGENLLDLKQASGANATYTAMIPIGAEVEEEVLDDSGEVVDTVKRTVTIETLEDGNVTDDIVKSGDMVYSSSGVEAYGWICAPVSETTWNDVTDSRNLLNKAAEALTTDLMLFANSIDISFVDLHFTDKEIQTFRIYRNVKVRSVPNWHSGLYKLLKLQIPLDSPKSTRATVGSTQRTLTDINSQKEADTVQRIESAEKDIADTRTATSEVKNQVKTQSTEMANTASQIVFAALESYVETSSFEDFKKTLEAELTVWAGGISGKVTAAESEISKVNGDLQEKFNLITKYFTFDINGLTIGEVDNPNKVIIDNDDITIQSGNRIVQQFKVDGTALIPILTVDTAFNLLGLHMSATDTHIDCVYRG